LSDMRQAHIKVGHITDAIGSKRFRLRGKKVNGQWQMMTILHT